MQTSEILNTKFLLPEDVLVFPINEISPEQKLELVIDENDYVITRPNFRTHSKIIDKKTANFIQEFRKPKKIVDAIATYCAKKEYNPYSFLEGVFPIMQQLTNSLIIVPVDSYLTNQITSSLKAGDQFGGYKIERLIQTAEDSEVYQAIHSEGAPVALKISKKNPPAYLELSFKREAAVLNLLDGVNSPLLLDHGKYNGHLFLASQWINGVPVHMRTNELRDMKPANWKFKLFEICKTIIQGYVVLHEHGILHGDVHFRNILINKEDEIIFLDFGLANIQKNTLSDLNDGRRAGNTWSMDPELATSLLGGQHSAPLTFAGEQYALSSLIYILICGKPYIKLSQDKQKLYQDIINLRPLPFANQGFESCPDIEKILSKGLDKDPEKRYSSVKDFEIAFSSCRPLAFKSVESQEEPYSISKWMNLFRTKIDRVSNINELYPKHPYASIYYGGTGLLWYLYRLAMLTEKSEFLTQASIIRQLLEQSVQLKGAFESQEIGITPDRVGPESIYHRASGFWCVHSLVSHACGEYQSANKGIEKYQQILGATSNIPEISFGKSGLLLGGALLNDIGFSSAINTDQLGNDLLILADSIWDQLRKHPDIGASNELPHLGIAHGWAGMLHAQLRIRQSIKAPIPSDLPDRLEQLANYGQTTGRGITWIGTIPSHTKTRTPGNTPGWCSGSSGYVFLWTLAHKLIPDQKYIDLAQKSAWFAWEYPEQEIQLCCGMAGRIYAYLNLYKSTGDLSWLQKARKTGAKINHQLNQGIRWKERSMSLFRGELGAALACLECLYPEHAAMPLMESEGWPGS